MVVWAEQDDTLEGLLLKEVVADNEAERAIFERFCAREFDAGRRVPRQF